MRKPVPPYVDEMVEGAVSRLNNLKNEHTVSFAFVTDTHNCMDLTERTLYAINQIDRQLPVAFTCFGGDYLCNNSHTSRETALAQHRELKAALDELGEQPPVMVVKGNHDGNPFGKGENCLNPDEIYDILMPHHRRRFSCDPEAPKSMYGYYDVPDAKLRAIFLNVMDTPFVLQNGEPRYRGGVGAIGSRQLNWLAHDALQLPGEGWGIVLFSHFMPIASTVTQDRVFGGDALWEVLCAFRNGDAYRAKAEKGDLFYDVSCDFRAQGKGELIAFICGHNHADRTCKCSGIRMISTLAAASDNFETGVCGDGQIHAKTRGSGEESAFSVFTVDRAARRIFCVRCGAGPDYSVDY